MVLSLTGRASLLPVLFAITLSLTVVACGDKQTPEEQIRQYISSAVSVIERRDVIALSKLISDRYSDSAGRDRRALVGLATGYFLRHKNIHLFTRIKDIGFPASDTASVKLYVAMTGTPVTGAQALIDLRADLVEFDLFLIKESDEWQLLKADWLKASVEDLFGNE